MTERREPARSGWCLCGDHDRCVWSGCHCSCGHGVDLNSGSGGGDE